MKEIVRLIVEMPIYYISGFFPKKKSRIIFGAWKGKNYSDNSKYMCEYLSELNVFDLVWCSKNINVKECLPSNVRFVKYGSLKSIFFSLTSKYAFVTHSYDDIVKFNVFRNAILVQLWHGIGIKKIGELTINKNKLKERLKKAIRTLIRKYNFFICSSKANEERNLIAFASYGITQKNIIKSGQPRNDFLVMSKEKEDVRKKILNKYNLPKNKKIITYLPTFRKGLKHNFSFLNLSGIKKNKLLSVLNDNKAIILEKNHNSSLNKSMSNKSLENLLCLNNIENIDTHELLLITDLLITDYSSCYIDFLILDRPIIHFSYDLEKYKSTENGFYYDFNTVVGGSITNNLEKLFSLIDEELKKPKKNKKTRQQVRQTMLEYENGESRKKICEEIGII